MRAALDTTGRAASAEAAHLEWLLDEALQETFPASDSVAICVEKNVVAAEPTGGDEKDSAQKRDQAG